MNVSNVSSKERAPGLLVAALNQDNSLLALGTKTGFSIFSTSDLTLKTARSPFSVLHIELLYSTNLIALVSETNRLLLWDDIKGNVVAELSFAQDIVGIRMRKERLIVALKTKIVVYQLAAQPFKLFTIETIENPNGIMALSTKITSCTLAFPAGQVGQVHLMELPLKVLSANDIGKVQTPIASIIPAHTSKIAAMALSDTGEWLATASEKGTLIRIFDCKSGKLMHELRRGMDEAYIYSIQFNLMASRIIVSSDKGTIHIFNLPNLSDGESADDSTPHTPALSKKPSLEQLAPANKHSAFSFLSPLLPKYFASEWSFAHFSISVDSRCIAAFVNGETIGKQDIIVVCADGSVYKYGLDLKTGNCQQEQYEWLIKQY